jgi:hypothetical protein
MLVCFTIYRYGTNSRLVNTKCVLTMDYTNYITYTYYTVIFRDVMLLIARLSIANKKHCILTGSNV